MPRLLKRPPRRREKKVIRAKTREDEVTQALTGKDPKVWFKRVKKLPYFKYVDPIAWELISREIQKGEPEDRKPVMGILRMRMANTLRGAARRQGKLDCL